MKGLRLLVAAMGGFEAGQSPPIGGRSEHEITSLGMLEILVAEMAGSSEFLGVLAGRRKEHLRGSSAFSTYI